jgi:hypothetical protein
VASKFLDDRCMSMCSGFSSRDLAVKTCSVVAFYGLFMMFSHSHCKLRVLRVDSAFEVRVATSEPLQS